MSSPDYKAEKGAYRLRFKTSVAVLIAQQRDVKKMQKNA